MVVTTKGKAVRGVVVAGRSKLPDVGRLKHPDSANPNTQIADGTGVVVDSRDDFREELAPQILDIALFDSLHHLRLGLALCLGNELVNELINLRGQRVGGDDRLYLGGGDAEVDV